MTINKSHFVIDKDESFRLPKWLVIALLPTIVSAAIGWSAGKVSTAKMEQSVETLKTEMDKKINKAEANIQFLYIRDDLAIIKGQLSGVKVNQTNTDK